MTVQSSAFGIFFRDNLDTLFDDFADSITTNFSEQTLSVSIDRTAPIKKALLVIAESIINDDPEAAAVFARQTGELRARQHIAIADMLLAFARMRDYVWQYLDTYLEVSPPWTHRDVRAVEDVLHAYQRSYFGGFSVVYQDMQSDLLAQAAVLEEQRRLVHELGTPIVPIYEGVLLLPLVGTIDEDRAAQITESVLEEIGRAQADLILVDITGVSVIDAYVANHLMVLTRAVNLLGAQVVLVGIRAEIAQTIIQLGVDISGIVTRANLQAGMIYALQQRGIRI